MITLQKKIDGQSLANLDDVPWYGVGPSEPTPVPVLGPDIIDPRQMELIREQAQQAALEAPFGARELPAWVNPAEVAQEETAVAETQEGAEDGIDPAKAARIRKREEAMARLAARRAAKGGQ